jgi:hypothetical protein
MADTGWIYASSARNIAGANEDWTNPDNAKTQNSVYAIADIVAEYTDYLNTYNYGFSIPAGRTINGIYVAVYRHAEQATHMKDKYVYLMDGTATKGNNKYSGSFWPTSDTYQYYGGSSDLWGASWTVTQINNSDFGIGLVVVTESVAKREAYVDSMAIKVYYSDAPVDADHLMIMGM